MLVDEHGLTVTRACQAVRLSRTAYYEPPPARERATGMIRGPAQAVVENERTMGLAGNASITCASNGAWWNPEAGASPDVYCALGLNLPRRTRRRIPRNGFGNRSWLRPDSISRGRSIS